MKLFHRKHQSPAPEKDDFDRLLDTALAQYTRAEPRPGLEDRILANLHSSAVPVEHHSWWRWGIATALAGVLLALAIGLSSPKPHSPSAYRTTPAQLNPSVESQRLGPDPGVGVRQAPIDISAASAITLRRKPRLPGNPKLDQFPSPQPLSKEEIALAQYVNNFPKEAQLVADAQMQFEIETEKEMNDAGSETRPSNTASQER